MKYLGLLAAGLLLIVLALSWKLAEAPARMPASTADRGALQAQLREADAQVERTRALADQLDALAVGVYAEGSGAEVIAFVRPKPAIDPALAAIPNFPERTVSLVYEAHGFQRAVIDGVYAGEGDRLPGGGRVHTIAQDRVVIMEREGTQVIRLDPRASISPARGGR